MPMTFLRLHLNHAGVDTVVSLPRVFLQYYLIYVEKNPSQQSSGETNLRCIHVSGNLVLGATTLF